MTVNALIVSSYEAAERHKRRQQQKQQDEPSTNSCDNDIEIYNYVSSVQNPLTWGQFCHLNMAYGFEYPFSSAIWYVIYIFTLTFIVFSFLLISHFCFVVDDKFRFVCFYLHKSYYMNKLFTILLHIIPALLVDFFFICCAKKPK
jgi:hypothetical protein